MDPEFDMLVAFHSYIGVPTDAYVPDRVLGISIFCFRENHAFNITGYIANNIYIIDLLIFKYSTISMYNAAYPPTTVSAKVIPFFNCVPGSDVLFFIIDFKVPEGLLESENLSSNCEPEKPEPVLSV